MAEPTDGERAAFEAGIKFGTLYHQFAGTPVSPTSADSLARAMEESIENQPFCTAVDVDVDEARLREAIGADLEATTDDESTADDEQDATDVAAYTELTGTLFDATIDVDRAGHGVTARLETEDDYPLMRLETVDRPE